MEHSNSEVENKDIERCTIVVMPRDRFSTMKESIDSIFEHTPEPFDLIVIMGGAPEKVRKNLEDSYSSKAQMIFKPEFLNGAQMRNMALPMIKTRLAVLMDGDVFVKPNWLTPLIQCQVETGASLVSPVIVGPGGYIHAAGGELYVTHENGKAYGAMELKYAHQYVGEDTNIKRFEMDFGEIHIQLVVVETAQKLGIYNERIRENHELDSGMTLKSANCKQILEPRSIVYYSIPKIIDDVDDIRYYLWKWNLEVIQDSMNCFHEKWGIDVNRNNTFLGYFTAVINKVGYFSRRYPSKWAIFLDRVMRRIRVILQKIFGDLIQWVTLAGK